MKLGSSPGEHARKARKLREEVRFHSNEVIRIMEQARERPWSGMCRRVLDHVTLARAAQEASEVHAESAGVRLRGQQVYRDAHRYFVNRCLRND